METTLFTPTRQKTLGTIWFNPLKTPELTSYVFKGKNEDVVTKSNAESPNLLLEKIRRRSFILSQFLPLHLVWLVIGKIKSPGRVR